MWPSQAFHDGCTLLREESVENILVPKCGRKSVIAGINNTSSTIASINASWRSTMNADKFLPSLYSKKIQNILSATASTEPFRQKTHQFTISNPFPSINIAEFRDGTIRREFLTSQKTNFSLHERESRCDQDCYLLHKYSSHLSLNAAAQQIIQKSIPNLSKTIKKQDKTPTLSVLFNNNQFFKVSFNISFLLIIFDKLILSILLFLSYFF